MILRIRLNRWWRLFLIGLAAYAVIGVVVLAFVPDLAGLFLLGAYCMPANSILPIPHEPAVLYFAKFYDPVLVAAAALIGSLIASFADYAVIGSATKLRVFDSTRRSRLFRWAMRAMERWPFAIIVLFSFTPMPITVIRILAPASGYPIGRYLVAQLVGRFPRFLILAWIGRVLMIPTWGVVAMLAILVLAVYVSSRGPSLAPELAPGADPEAAPAPDNDAAPAP